VEGAAFSIWKLQCLNVSVNVLLKLNRSFSEAASALFERTELLVSWQPPGEKRNVSHKNLLFVHGF
jgi:hypothetical protein